MLTEQQAEKVLSLMRSSTVEDRLSAIEQAQEMFRDSFNSGMDLGDWAKSAQIIEHVFNLVRNELKQGFRLAIAKEANIDEDSEESSTPKKKKLKMPAINGTVKTEEPKEPKPKKFVRSYEMSDDGQIQFLMKMFKITEEEAIKKIEEQKGKQ